jgi:hypothetical protein
VGRSIRFAARGLVIAAAFVVAMAVPATAQEHYGDVVAPKLECVTINGDGTYTALFGTENYWDVSVYLPHGSWNRITPAGVDGGDRPEWIQPGRRVGVFTVTQTVGQPINFKLGITSVQATSQSLACNSAPQVAEAPVVAGLIVVAGAVAAIGYRRLTPAPV